MWYDGSMKRRILAFLSAVILAAGVVNLGVGMRFSEAEAAGCSTGMFGLKPWYDGIASGDPCTIDSNAFSEDKLPGTIVGIIMNVLYDLFYVAGIGAVVMIVYSGFLMITAAGEVGKYEKAKKSLRMAITGLIICVLATVIVGVVKAVFW